MGLHFYKSYQTGVTHFQDFGGQKIQVCRDLKIKIKFDKCVSSCINRKWKSWDCKNYFFPKVTKMGSIIWPHNRLLWGRGSERPTAHIQQKLTQVPSPPPPPHHHHHNHPRALNHSKREQGISRFVWYNKHVPAQWKHDVETVMRVISLHWSKVHSGRQLIDP